LIRINKFLAQCNLGSRRQVETLITSGKIKVNGIIVTDLTSQIEIGKDIVEFEGSTLSSNKENFYIMLNKPIKYITTSKDEFDRKTVYELIPDFRVHLFSVGRLDYMSEGLLIFTSDGDFADKIIHPRYKLPKVYKVTIKGSLSDEQIQTLRDGVKIEGKLTSPAIVHVKKSNVNSSVLKMTIFEGRKRQIRKMIKTVGSEVMQLKRLQIGEVQLGKLPKGMWRPLKSWEVMSLINQSRKQGK
jgi:23S rRNA pseudouridine2605 synthase